MASFKEFRETLAADKARWEEENEGQVSATISGQEQLGPDALYAIQAGKSEWETLKSKGLWSPDKMVNAVDFQLKKWVDSGDITESQQDQLRHYYGILEIAKQYGTNIAWFLGELNEVSIMPQASYDERTGTDQNSVQIQVDKLNNELAISDFDSNNYKLLTNDTTLEELQEVINKTYTPPNKDLPFNQQQVIFEEEIFKKNKNPNANNEDKTVFNYINEDEEIFKEDTP